MRKFERTFYTDGCCFCGNYGILQEKMQSLLIYKQAKLFFDSTTKDTRFQYIMRMNINENHLENGWKFKQ